MTRPLEVTDASAMPADLTTVGVLARRSLAARRRGADLRVQGAGPRLRELLELAGLDAVLLDPPQGRRSGGAGSVEVVGEAEVGEEGGTDEVRDARDLAVAHAEDVDRPRLPPRPDAGGLVLRESG